ncbi:MAG: ATP-binding protein [Panacagrimonas sp.]
MSRPWTQWRQWRDWSLGAKSAVAVAVPLLLLLASLAFSYRLQQSINEADADVRRALAIQSDIQTLNSQIAESAMAVRGFLLTGRDEFLDPLRSARRAMPRVLSTLRRNIRDAEMRSRLTRVEELLQRKLESLDHLQTQGPVLAPQDLQAHLIGSKGLLDELRAEIRAMNAREVDLVAQYSDAARRAIDRNLWVQGLASVLVLISGIVAFILLLSGIVLRVKRLAVNAERLVQGEAMESLPAGRDELGLMAERLHNASLLLAARAAEAQSASQAKTQFLSRISHELRTPLNAILGFAQLLESDLRNTAHAAQIEPILQAGRHLLALIDEVLDISRIEAGGLQLVPEPLAIQPLVEEAHDLVAALAQGHGVTVQVSPDLAAHAVHADRKRLLQVLINLLSNAIKYNRVNGQVQVSADRSEEHLWIRVRDTGAGIAPERVDRLFVPFDRLDAEHGPVEGTGLGLAVSRQLMVHMGGDIEVKTALGQGSEFALRLPRATHPAVMAAPAADAPRPCHTAPHSTARRLLVIEDNRSNLALLQAIVARRPQWQLLAAHDGEEGLRLARTLLPDLILLDLHLPVLGGEAVLDALRADAALRDIPVVIVSADALPDTITRLRKSGVQDYLTKPLAVPQVLALLDRSLE